MLKQSLFVVISLQNPKPLSFKGFTRFGSQIDGEDLSVTRSFYVCRAKRPQRTRILVTARSCVQLTSMNGTSLTLQLITGQRLADNTRHTSVKIWTFLLFLPFRPSPPPFSSSSSFSSICLLRYRPLFVLPVSIFQNWKEGRSFKDLEVGTG